MAGRPRKYTNWPPAFTEAELKQRVHCICGVCNLLLPGTKRFFHRPPKSSNARPTCKRCYAEAHRLRKKHIRDEEYASRSVRHIRRSHPAAQAAWVAANGPIPEAPTPNEKAFAKEEAALWGGRGRKPVSRALKRAKDTWAKVTDNLEDQTPAGRELILRIAQAVKAYQDIRKGTAEETPEMVELVVALSYLSD